MLDRYQFEDLWQAMMSLRYTVPNDKGGYSSRRVASISPRRGKQSEALKESISVHSAKSFVLAMNDICCDW